MTPLARLIEERGLRKSWIAKKAGITPQTFPVALRIAKVVGMTVEELWGYLIEK